MDEIEVKIIEVNPQKVRKTLKNLGATFVKKVFQKNYIYGNLRTKIKGYFVRISDEGKEVIVTVKGKKRVINNHKVRKEVEFKVKNIKEGEDFCELIGVKRTHITEMK